MAAGTDVDADQLRELAAILRVRLDHRLADHAAVQNWTWPTGADAQLDRLYGWAEGVWNVLARSGLQLSPAAPETFGVVDPRRGYGAGFRDPRGYVYDPGLDHQDAEARFVRRVTDRRVDPAVREAAIRLVPPLHLNAGASELAYVEAAIQRDLGDQKPPAEGYDAESGAELRALAGDLAARALFRHTAEVAEKLGGLGSGSRTGEQTMTALKNALEPLLGHLQHVGGSVVRMRQQPGAHAATTGPPAVEAAARSLTEGSAREGRTADVGGAPEAGSERPAPHRPPNRGSSRGLNQWPNPGPNPGPSEGPRLGG